MRARLPALGVAYSANGMAIQIYAALIASLMLVLWTNCKPNRRTWEMIQFYLSGRATLEEFLKPI